MGLMDKLNNDANLTRSSQPMKERKEDEGRGQRLLDSIEEHGVPDNVILLNENAYRRGGRQLGPSLMFAIFGSMFFLAPIGLMMRRISNIIISQRSFMTVLKTHFQRWQCQLQKFETITNPDPEDQHVTGGVGVIYNQAIKILPLIPQTPAMKSVQHSGRV